MEIPIDKIVVGDHNPRKVFDEKKLTKLKESIEIYGLVEPIVLSAARADGYYALIAGERRLRAHQLAGMPTIFSVVKDDFHPSFEEDLVLKLIENIQREDLNPMEEAYGIQQLKEKTSLNTPRSIAKSLGKSKIFVERRLAILEADKKVQKALMEGTITIGHALAICRLTKKAQKSLLNDILQGGYSVTETMRQIKWRDDIPALHRYPFDKRDCDGCKHNGGEQTILYKTGSDLKGVCLNPKCLIKKTNEWLKSKKEELIKQGAKITTKEDILKNHKNAVEIFHWNRDNALKDLKKHPGKYLVVLDPTNDVDKFITVFSISGKAKSASSNTGTPDTRLINKIQAWKRGFLIRYNKKSLEEDPKTTKVITAYFQINGASYSEQKKLLKEMKTYSDGYPSMEKVLRKLLEMDESELDKIILYESQIRMKEFWSDRSLEDIARHQGIKLKEDLVITESYLKLHTIDQLGVLAKELKLEIKKGKKTEMIKEFLKADLKGKIPSKFKTKLK